MDTKERGSLEPTGRREPGAPSEHPLTQFQRMMNLFNDAFTNWGLGWDMFPLDSTVGQLSSFNPRMDVEDDGKQLVVTVEVPGIQEKDVEVTLTDNLLTIKGEKHTQSEQKGRDFLRRERSYGSFRRSLRVGPEVDAGKVKASFKDGVLHVTLPKTPAAQKEARKIPIQS